MNHLPARGPGPRLLFALSAIALGSLLSGCAVVGAAASVAGTAVSVAGTVVSTGVSVTGKVVEKAIDVAIPDDQP
jgi:hypothetical protein